MGRRRVIVLGAGESGRGVALLARRLGYAVRVSDAGALSDAARAELDDASVPYEEGGHTRDDLDEHAVVVKSPGIPWEAPFVAFAKTRGAHVVGEMEFCARYAETPFGKTRRIGITGSNGKTTTTLLVTHLLNAAGLRAVACGNVGLSFARQLLAPGAYDWYVLELSSFQLEDIERFRVDVGLLLNLSPDHLDRYGGDFAAYAAAKYRLKDTLRPPDGSRGALGLWLQPGDPVSLAHATPWVGDFSSVTMPARFDDGVALAPWGEVSLAGTPLRGPHNAANASFALFAASAAIGLARGPEGAERAEPVLAEALATFRNAPHRLERVGYVGGVEWVNDSKATNLDAVEKALASYRQPIVWIAGGVDKGNDYAAVLPLVRERVRAIVALGVDNAKLRDAFGEFGGRMTETSDLFAAIEAARLAAQPGDVVLLSPACASFDLFANYIDRGDRFREAVRALPGFRETLHTPP